MAAALPTRPEEASMPRTIGRRLAAPAAAIVLALVGPVNAAHAKPPPTDHDARPAHTAPVLQTVATFDPSRGELAESVVATPDGTLYVSTIAAATIQVIASDGARTTIAVPLGPGGQLGTLALGRDGLYASSFTPPALWHISIPQPGQPLRAARRLATLPDGASPNGISFDRAGNLYAADSTQTLTRVHPNGTTNTLLDATTGLRVPPPSPSAPDPQHAPPSTSPKRPSSASPNPYPPNAASPSPSPAPTYDSAPNLAHAWGA